MKCFATQMAQYEGLTVTFSEMVNSAGGAILDADGNVNIDTPEAQEAVTFLSNGIQDGYIPEENMTFMEEESRRAFQSGDYMFLRNWPYVYNLAQDEGEDSKVQDKFDIALIPGSENVGASTLGGYNIGVSKTTDNPETAQDFINYMLSEDVQKRIIQETGEPPVRESLYEDEELLAELPTSRLWVRPSATPKHVLRPSLTRSSARFSLRTSTRACRLAPIPPLCFLT